MKNHWTDQKLMYDFMTELSEKVAPIAGVDAKAIFKVFEKDIIENPPTEEELKQLRESKDAWVAMFVEMAKDVKEKIKAALDDGLF